MILNFEVYEFPEYFEENMKNINTSYPQSELTSKIISACIEVHKAIGSGFQEVIYQRALAIEFKENNLSFHREYEIPLSFKGHNIGTRRVDFFIENQVMLEIKALKQLDDIHLAQAINYLEAYNLKVGLLVNFGSRVIQIKRVMNKTL